MAKKCDPMMVQGISMVVLGVLIYLNDTQGWLNWAQFVAAMAVLFGIVKVWMLKKK